MAETRAAPACRQAPMTAGTGLDEPMVDRPGLPGFDPALVGAAREALLRKRAGDVARMWPALAASFAARRPVRAGSPGPEWPAPFVAWAAGRPPAGALRDGWDFARTLAAQRALSGAAGRELADREARWRYDGTSAPRPRSLAGRILRGITG